MGNQDPKEGSGTTGKSLNSLAGVVSGWFPAAAWGQSSAAVLLLSNRLAPNNLPRVRDPLGV